MKALCWAVCHQRCVVCRREAVPLVCKAWRAASGADSPIWDVCELTHPAVQLKRPRAGSLMRWQAVVR